MADSQSTSSSNGLPEKKEQHPRRVVYFMCIDELKAIKIGVSDSVHSRRGLLQTAIPIPIRLLATMKGDHRTESSLHKKFRHLHIKGEWFDADEELLEFIRQNATPHNGAVIDVIPDTMSKEEKELRRQYKAIVVMAKQLGWTREQAHAELDRVWDLMPAAYD